MQNANSFIINVSYNDINEMTRLYELDPLVLEYAGKEALETAVFDGNLQIVKWLLNRGVDPNTTITRTGGFSSEYSYDYSSSILESASVGHDEKKNRNNKEVIKELISRGATITQKALDIVTALPEKKNIKKYFSKLVPSDVIYHNDYRLAKQLYIKHACGICGNRWNNDHKICSQIDITARWDIFEFIKDVCNMIKKFITFDVEILSSTYMKKIKTRIYPYTIRTFHDIKGAAALKNIYEEECRNIFLDILKEKRKCMDNQLEIESIDYDTIYKALVKDLHIISLAIDMIEGKIYFTLWQFPLHFYEYLQRMSWYNDLYGKDYSGFYIF